MNYLIALCDGHGTLTAGKESPPIPELNNRIIKENEFNREVVKYLDIELKRCGFDTLLVAPTDEDTPLKTRVDLVNSKKADAYISIHYNAFDGRFNDKDPEGLSVHVYPNNHNDRKLAECIHKYLIQGTPQVDRGIVESNFYVLREPKCPAVLTENGFMDNKKEALRMLDVDYQKEVAIEHAKGICEFFNIEYIGEFTTPLYRVQVGAFNSMENANRCILDLQAKGFKKIVIVNADKQDIIDVDLITQQSRIEIEKKYQEKAINLKNTLIKVINESEV